MGPPIGDMAQPFNEDKGHFCSDPTHRFHETKGLFIRDKGILSPMDEEARGGVRVDMEDGGSVPPDIGVLTVGRP